MPWYVDTVEARDFLSYKKLTWDLRKAPNVTALVGLRGVGKSSLFAAVCWLLYGKTPKSKLPAQKVIRRGAVECVVSGVVRDDAGEITITRTRSPRGVSVTIEGLEGKDATSEGVQSLIDRRFGNYETFTKTGMFSGDMSSFCRLGDSDRKELLETMVGIQHYSAAAEAAKKAADVATSEIEVWSRERDRLNQTIGRLIDERQRYAIQTFHYARVIWQQHAKLVKKAIALSAESNKAFRELSVWIRAADKEIDRIREQRVVHEQQIEKQEVIVTQIDEEIEGKRSAESKMRSAIMRIEDDLARHRTGTHADICPTCAQRWPQDVDVGAVAKVVEGLEADLLKARRAFAPTDSEIRELQAKRAEAEKSKSAIARTIRDLEATVDDKAYRGLLASAMEAEAALSQAQQAVIEFENSHEPEPDFEDIERIDAELAEVRGQVVEIDQKAAATQERLDHLLFWKKGFGRNGLPAWLIDSAVPDMTEVANDVVRELTDGLASIAFDSAASKGSGSVFDVKVDFDEGGDGFLELSRGEQMCADVSVLFAIRDLAAKRSGVECGQVFLDEVTDGADEHFCSCFLRMLRKRYGDLHIFIISHDPSVPAICDRVVRVKKVNGASCTA